MSLPLITRWRFARCGTCSRRMTRAALRMRKIRYELKSAMGISQTGDHDPRHSIALRLWHRRKIICDCGIFLRYRIGRNLLARAVSGFSRAVAGPALKRILSTERLFPERLSAPPPE